MTAVHRAAPCPRSPSRPRTLAFLATLATVLAAWFLLPEAPNYDTATHLVWAGDLLGGQAPQVTAVSAPTLHPLWLLTSLVSVATGGGAEFLQLLTLSSLALTIWCVFWLAEGIGGPLAGVAAALFCGSSFALLLLAFKAYGDLPFLALVASALALEARRVPLDEEGGRGMLTGILVPGLLLAAGLFRPEAWGVGLLLIALRLRERPRPGLVVLWASLILAAPLIWMLLDLALAGDALHSLTGTRELAAKLQRTTGLAQAPWQAVLLTADLVRPPVALLGLAGIAISAGGVRARPVAVPLATFVAGLAGFVVVGAAGLPLLQRYIQLAALMLCVFAGVAIGRALAVARSARFSGPVRAAGAAALIAASLVAGGYAVSKVSSFARLARGVVNEARWHRQGAELVTGRSVAPYLRCGPVTLPSYRFVPELTISGGFARGKVLSRAESFGGAGQQRTGVAIVVEGSRAARRRLAWAPGVARSSNRPPVGFAVVDRRGPLVAYGRCDSS